jgi:cell wall-associated NlpC family hydrolase
MPNVRALRLTRGLTLTELALQVGIPARTLAEIEYGLRPLAPDSRCNLARIYDLQPDVLESRWPGPLDDSRVLFAQLLGTTLVAGIWLAGTLAFVTTPAADQRSIAESVPNAAIQSHAARTSLTHARPLGSELRPAPRIPTPRHGGVHQSPQYGDFKTIDARSPASQSTVAGHRWTEVRSPVPAAVPTEPPAPADATAEAPPAPTEAPPAPAGAAPPPTEILPAPTEGPPASTEAPPAPAEVPPASSGRGSEVAAFAMQFVGAPYAWSGADPDGFDCSGFTQYVYRQFGVDLPRIAADQYSDQYGRLVTDPNELAPGDLVFFANTFEPGISHVGIYIGDGDVVQAMSPGIGVAVGNLREDFWAQHYYGALRVFG